jgi:periplasmic protein TonB
MPETMFGTLETTWDHSARRRWTTLASFTAQLIALSSLVVLSMIWVELPPQVHWLQISAPASFTPGAETHAAPQRGERTTTTNPRRTEIFVPTSIPLQTSMSNDADSAPSAPEFSDFGIGTGRRSGNEVLNGIGDGVRVAIPPRPVAVKPLVVSVLSEANLLHRVQPVYPPIAREAHVQGTVELRAIISKTGTIENLVVVRGHPMLAGAAIEAVRQWRYRPYLLNNEPVEVETNITVNFLLSGG